MENIRRALTYIRSSHFVVVPFNIDHIMVLVWLYSTCRKEYTQLIRMVQVRGKPTAQCKLFVFPFSTESGSSVADRSIEGQVGSKSRESSNVRTK